MVRHVFVKQDAEYRAVMEHLECEFGDQVYRCEAPRCSFPMPPRYTPIELVDSCIDILGRTMGPGRYEIRDLMHSYSGGHSVAFHDLEHGHTYSVFIGTTGAAMLDWRVFRAERK